MDVMKCLSVNQFPGMVANHGFAELLLEVDKGVFGMELKNDRFCRF